MFEAMLARVDIPTGFETVLPAGPLDPIADPARVTQRLSALRDVGATVVTATVPPSPPTTTAISSPRFATWPTGEETP